MANINLVSSQIQSLQFIVLLQAFANRKHRFFAQVAVVQTETWQISSKSKYLQQVAAEPEEVGVNSNWFF